MTPLRNQGQSYGHPPAADPNAILNQCRDVDRGIDSVESYIDRINGLYRRLLSDADPARENAIRSEADELASETKSLYRNLIERMRGIKGSPDAGSPRNAPQIGKVERRLKAAIQSYQRVQRDFQKGLEAQMARQYRIVRPDATDTEVQEAVQDTSNQQIFSQAVSEPPTINNTDAWFWTPLTFGILDVVDSKRSTRRRSEGFSDGARQTRRDPEDRTRFCRVGPDVRGLGRDRHSAG